MNHDLSASPKETQAQAPSTLNARLQALESQVRDLQAALTGAHTLFEDSPTAALVLTPQGRLLDVNVRAAALLGASRQVLLGRRLAPALAPACQSAFAALLARLFAGQGRQTGEVELLRPGGERLNLTVEAALHVREGEPPSGHLTLTDVTAFKLAHRALWDLQQAQETQLQEQALTVRQLQDEFESVLLKSGRELDHALTRAQNFLTLAQHHPGAPGHQLHAQEAVEQTQTLLTSLKHYMQVRFLRARMRQVDLGRVLREVLKDVEYQQAGRDVQITSAPLPTVYGDSQVLQIILREYVTNALKFTRTRPQARLHVQVQEDAAEYRIGVEDNGVGFNVRYRERAFEIFGRLHASGTYEGTGLGLTVVRRLCERFGGRAWGEGKVDQGATFWFAWPKSPPGG